MLSKIYPPNLNNLELIFKVSRRESIRIKIRDARERVICILYIYESVIINVYCVGTAER